MVEKTTIEVVPNTVDVEVLDNNSIELTINKREFNVVGDNVYIAKISETPPQWLADTINTVVSNTLATTMNEIQALKTAIIDELNVVKNQYTQAINQIATAESSFVSAVETLNATYLTTQATIANIQTTYATKNEASALALDVVQSELEDGLINAELVDVRNTFVTPLNATSQSLSILSSQYTDLESGIGSNAETSDLLRTYVGMDEAGAYQNTGLSAYICDSAGVVGGGTSQVANSMYTEIVGGVPVTKSKWEYNSQIMKPDGTMVNSGFGLKSGDFSEFWINADKFKMTNNTGATPNATPVFSIDTTDGNKVKFNGKVTFGDSVIDTINPANTLIDGGRITTGSISANQIAVNSITATRINTDGLIVQELSDGTINPNFEIKADSTAGPVGDKTYNISGARIYGSYLTGGVISSTYLQNAIAFDTFTEYTGCTEFPSGAPILGMFSSSSSGNSSNSTTATSFDALGNRIVTLTGNSGILPYQSCDSSVYKLKNGTTKIYLNSLVNAIRVGGTGPYGAAVPNINIATSVCGFAYNAQGLGMGAANVYDLFDNLSLTLSIRGTTFLLNESDLYTGLSILYEAVYEDSHQLYYYKVIDLFDIWKVVVVISNGSGTLNSINGALGGGKGISIYLGNNSNISYFNNNTGVYTGDVFTYRFTVGTSIKPATYYNNPTLIFSSGIPGINVNNLE